MLSACEDKHPSVDNFIKRLSSATHHTSSIFSLSSEFETFPHIDCFYVFLKIIIFLFYRQQEWETCSVCMFCFFLMFFFYLCDLWVCYCLLLLLFFKSIFFFTFHFISSLFYFYLLPLYVWFLFLFLKDSFRLSYHLYFIFKLFLL